MYESPIECQINNLHNLVMQSTEDGILKAVWNMGFTVDAEQLSLALHQDRKRYESAYEKGWNDCKKHYEDTMAQITKIVTDANEKGE